MNKEIIGIIAEFNPLHNGHKKLINKIKEKNPDSIIVVAMSGNFVQRGDLSIYNKWIRANAALEQGVDLVIEIPPFYVLNYANIFAKKSLEILNEFGVKKIYFGSENLSIKQIEKISNKIIEGNDELEKLKKETHSLPKAIDKFLKYKSIKSNDILGICYILESKKLNMNIKFKRIKRLSNKEFTSASKIRNDIKNGYKNKHSLINDNEKWLDINEYSDIIIGKIATSNVNDNVINYLKNKILLNKIKTFNDLIDISSNKGYTKSRLRRDILRFVLELKGNKNKIILATNDNGKQILKKTNDYSFRHKKENDDNYKVERFISLKRESFIKNELSIKTIIK